MPYLDRGKIRLNKHPKYAYARRGGNLPYSRSLCRYATLLHMGHTWGTDESKDVIEGVTLPQT